MVLVGYDGFASPPHVRAMMALGIVATAIYAYLFFAPWRRFRRAVSSADWAVAGRHLRQLGFFVVVTLAFGLAAAVIGASGRYYG